MRGSASHCWDCGTPALAVDNGGSAKRRSIARSYERISERNGGYETVHGTGDEIMERNDASILFWRVAREPAMSTGKLTSLRSGASGQIPIHCVFEPLRHGVRRHPAKFTGDFRTVHRKRTEQAIQFRGFAHNSSHRGK